MVDALKKHCATAKTVTGERYIFNVKTQKQTEQIADFNVELKTLSALCDFTESVEEALRDRFVCGLKSQAIIVKLL